MTLIRESPPLCFCIPFEAFGIGAFFRVFDKLLWTFNFLLSPKAIENLEIAVSSTNLLKLNPSVNFIRTHLLHPFGFILLSFLCFVIFIFLYLMDDPVLPPLSFLHLQAWFRELPTRVLDSLTPEQVMRCNTEDDCTRLVNSLPATEASLLDWALNLMADVAQNEQYNKMNARNIAMVFAPNMTEVCCFSFRHRLFSLVYYCQYLL